jgi:hypothetical protein
MSEAYPIDEHFLQTRGWKQSEASFLWIRPADSTGTFFTLKDAIRIERNREKLERESEPQPPSAASAGYHYADAKVVIDEKPKTGIEKAFADWLQALKNAEAARIDLAVATRNLNAYRPAVNSPVVLFAHATLYVLEFGSDNGIEYEVAVSAEQAQQAYEDIPF